MTLYRKYRPQSFTEVIGQNHIKTTIQSELESGKIAHAYLFSGPRGLGKTTMARLLAKAVNCSKRQPGKSEPCNECEACQEIIAARSLDVIEIDAASHTGVDNVRENIINNSRFTPSSRKYKVFIIDEVHMLSSGAFNALLKTLEEPPAHVIFILATTEIYKVPETIISRCQHFDFRKVAESEIVGRLEEITRAEKKRVERTVLENIAYHAGGCMRDAESLLGQILSLDGEEITAEQAELVLPRSRFDLNLELIEYLVKFDASGAISLINRLVEEGIDLEKFTADLIEVLRKMLLIKVSSNLSQYAGGLSKDLQKRAAEAASRLALDYLVNIIEILLAKRQELKYAEPVQLPLELAVLEIIGDNAGGGKPKAGDDPDPIGQPNNKSDEPKIAKPKAAAKSEVIKAEQTDEPVKKSAGKMKLNLQQVKDKWEEVMAGLKKYNASLASTLKISQPLMVGEDGTLEICLRHKFHQQRINDQKNKQLLEKILQEIFGVQLIVKTVVVEALDDKEIDISALGEKPGSDNALGGLLETFGGQVIE